MEGRFRRGTPVGKVFYYDMQGVLERKEISRFKKLKTTFYYPDGKVQLKGQARLDNEPGKVHYYFFGRWKHYDEQGRLLKYRYYEKGVLIRTEYLDKNNPTNDSLIGALNSFDKRFSERDQDFVNKINASWMDHRKAEQYRVELMRFDSLLFSDVENYLDRFGYPSRKVTGEAANIPFFILSYATAGVKEKHLDQLWGAVRNGDLEAKTLVFYIDKMKLAVGKPQVYGTQGYLDTKKRAFLEYPCIEPVIVSVGSYLLIIPTLE